MSPELENPPPSQDNESDYGDISLEEQEILEALLEEVNSAANFSSVAGNATLKITDIEDYEDPRGIRLSKTVGVELWEKNNRPASQIGIQDQTRVAIESFPGTRSPIISSLFLDLELLLSAHLLTRADTSA